MTLVKQLAAPVRAYFNPRFEALADLVRQGGDRAEARAAELQARTAELQARMGELADRLDAASRVEPARASEATAGDTELERQAQLLARVDVSAHNAGARPSFDDLVSQAANADDFFRPAFIAWAGLVHPDERDQVPFFFHRKLWEWVYIAEAVRQSGCLRQGASALGFGVGNEPVPAMLARHGLRVLATDQALATSGEWSATGQHLQGLRDLLRPEVVPDDELARLVRVRAVDMNEPLDELGTYDVVWSSCALEHLGSPEAGLDFVLRSARLLEPGGVAVHTTELELTSRDASAEYGHCAVYRRSELLELAERLRAEGFSCAINPYVSLDTPEERWISQELSRGDGLDLAHLRLQIFDSISTSMGLLVRRPA